MYHWQLEGLGIWWFPAIGVPPDHPFESDFPLYKATILDISMTMEPPSIHQTTTFLSHFCRATMPSKSGRQNGVQDLAGGIIVTLPADKEFRSTAWVSGYRLTRRPRKVVIFYCRILRCWARYVWVMVRRGQVGWGGFLGTCTATGCYVRDGVGWGGGY